MVINLYRYNSSVDHTNGLTLIDCQFECYTIEDEKRTKKIYGETRIPDGAYKIKLRTYGGFHQRYLAKFGSEFHKGMLELIDVPGFTDILIHMGNDDDDTAGCIIVGSSNDSGKNWVGNSKGAYVKLYPKVVDRLLKGEEVIIDIQTLDHAA